MVELARDATQALATLARETFDLIITDYHMPGLKGDELASRIKAEAPSQKIMILTGAADDLLKSVPPVRADAIIRKPFQASEFLAAIRKLLEADVRPASSIEAVVAQDLLQSDRQQTNLPFSY
jgi:CheY-like chemotaxis protein